MPLFDDLRELRQQFLIDLKSQVLYEREFTDKMKPALARGMFPRDQQGTVNVADVSNYVSSRIGWEWGRRLPGDFHEKNIKGQTAGDRFTSAIRKYLEVGVSRCQDLRRTNWRYTFDESYGGKKPKSKAKNPRIKASEFAQYAHLSKIKETFEQRPDLEAVFGSDYIVEPDIVVFGLPLSPDTFGGRPQEPVATFSPLISDAEHASGAPLLHASVSCKLTIRSDRAQNARLEALNLIRTRKGRVPHIMFITAEPLPSRISSLALGTGDVDCIYHAGLYELIDAVEAAIAFGVDRLPSDDASADPRLQILEVEPESEEEDADAGSAEATPTKRGLERQRYRLNSMIAQGRLRDVSDLLLDILI
jgi:hypothetical protein